MFLTILDLLYALSLAFPPAEARRSASVRFISEVAPLWGWALLWLIVGVVCAIGAFSRKDQFAFSAAMGLKVLWGVIFTLGWLLAHVERGWVSGVIWLAFAGFVWLIGSWPESPPKRRER